MCTAAFAAPSLSHAASESLVYIAEHALAAIMGQVSYYMVNMPSEGEWLKKDTRTRLEYVSLVVYGITDGPLQVFVQG